MRKLIQKFFSIDDHLVGINQRNLRFVYPNNPRKHFPLANDKVLSKLIIERSGLPIPKTYAIIDRLWEINEKLDSLFIYDEIVIKPANGSGGGGILILFRKSKDEWQTHDGEIYTREKLINHIASIIYGVFSYGSKDRAIVEYCLDPHSFLTNIYNKGIPDFRIIVYKELSIMAMLRVPTNKSKGKANLHQGAMGIGVDMDYGILREGFYQNKYICCHPDTGYSFYGQRIPGWKNILKISEQVAKLFPLRYLGIDIIIDKHLGPMVIEINARPGLQIQNINKIGLRDVLVNKNMN